MGNQPPKTILIDQDAAITKVIEHVFPTTCHRLCLWNILKSAPSYLGPVNSNPKFHSLFHKCMQGCDSEEEFEVTRIQRSVNIAFMDIVHWRKCMGFVTKWVIAFSKDTFSTNFKSSQRNESKNSVLSEIASKTTSLTNFLVAFQNW